MINCFLKSRDLSLQYSWMKNSWCGIASMTSKTSVLIRSGVDARCVAWSLYYLLASAALPTILMAQLVHFISATAALLTTLVACLMLLCPVVCPAILTQEPMPSPPQSLASLTSGGGSLGLERSLPLMTSWQWLLKGTHLWSGGLMVFMWTQRWMALTCTYWCHLCSLTRSTMVARLKFKGQTGSTKNIGKYQWF